MRKRQNKILAFEIKILAFTTFPIEYFPKIFRLFLKLTIDLLLIMQFKF